MNKKVLLWIIGLLLLSSIVSAGRIGDAFGKVTDGVGKFADKFSDVEGWYDKRPQLIDFLVFTLLFLLIAYLGLSRAFKEQKNVVIVMSIVIGVILGFAAIKAGLSVKFFIPFVKNALFFVVAVVVYFVLTKIGMEKHKIWAAIIALVVTFVMFNLFGLFTGTGLASDWFGPDVPDEDLTLVQMHTRLDKFAATYGVTNKPSYSNASNEIDIVKRITGKADVLIGVLNGRIKQWRKNKDNISEGEYKTQLENLRLDLAIVKDIKSEGRSLSRDIKDLWSQLAAIEGRLNTTRDEINKTLGMINQAENTKNGSRFWITYFPEKINRSIANHKADLDKLRKDVEEVKAKNEKS